MIISLAAIYATFFIFSFSFFFPGRGCRGGLND